MKKLITFLIVCLVIGGGFFYYINQFESESTLPKEEKTMLEGSLGYPSEEIPEDITICAKKIGNDKEYCTNEQIEDSKYKYGKGYKLEIEPGEYYVVAKKGNSNFKGYYSTYVKCGMEENCVSHFPIVVTARKGDYLKEINLLDWTDRSRDFAKEYRNHNFNFKVNYPEKVQINEDLRSREIYFTKKGNEKPNLTIIAHSNEERLSLSEWINNEIDLGEGEFKAPIIFGDKNSRAIFAKTYKSIGVTKEIDRVFYKGEDDTIFELNSGASAMGAEGEERNIFFSLITFSFERIEKEVEVLKPGGGTEISSPLTVKGRAKGTWFFEANLGLKLVDNQGNIIAQAPAMTESNWQTENIIPFKGTLEFETNKKMGKIIVEKDNPSGLPENADKIEIPVSIN